MFWKIFQTENLLLCADAVPNVLNFFDTTVAPPLLFYSYIPILLITVFFATLVLFKDKFSFLSKLLFLVAFSFAMWILNVLIQWTAVHASVVYFAWQLTALFEISVYLFSFYFVYHFTYRAPMQNFLKASLLVLALPVIVLLPTVFNMEAFDLVYCEAFLGRLWDYIYAMESIIIFLILYLGFKGYKIAKARGDRKSFLLLITGTFFFLLTFFLSNFIGEITRVYEFNLVGPIGAVLFFTLLTYNIVRFKMFKLKILGVQALVVALWILVFGLLFVHTLSLVQTIVIITLTLITVVGYLLIRGFDREVRQREEITLLAHDLQKANARLKELDKQKTEFVSLASHQLRGPITAINGYVGMILAGEYGEVINQDAKDALKKVQIAGKDLGVLVGDYLDVTRIELGRMSYTFTDVSLAQIAREVFDQMLPVTEHANLALSKDISEEEIIVHADANKIKQVMLNLVDNAVKYTPNGSIVIGVKKVGSKVQFSVTDTGTGMSQKVLESIFEKFVRAPGAQRINSSGTGLGLFVARKIITEHKGRIWAESAGEGKGSTFLFEIEVLA